MLPKKQIALAFRILYTIYVIARMCDLLFPEIYISRPWCMVVLATFNVALFKRFW